MGDGGLYLPNIYYTDGRYVYYFESDGQLGELDNVTYVEERTFYKRPTLDDMRDFKHKVTGRYWYAENGDLIAESPGSALPVTYLNEGYLEFIGWEE